MKLTSTFCAALLAAASSLAAAHPHDLPAPPAPPAPPAAPHAAMPAPPAPPAIPALPPLPPAPPAIEIPDDVLAACEGKADRSRIEMTASNGARIAGTCRKRGNVYAFMLESYRLHTTKRN